MLNNRSILITGGTGSFGKMFTKTILENYPEVTRLVIYSRDELKQFEAQTEGNFGGVGIQLGVDPKTGYLTVIMPFMLLHL